MPEISYFGANEMKESERREFMTWYEERRDKVFDNRRVLEQYCQDDVTVLREACQIFRRDFMEIGNIDVFLEAITIASAYNKVLRKKFLKPSTIGLIPTGGYSCNKNYSKKALMWLLHMQQVDNRHIMHARNGREYTLPELTHFSVDGYCEETRTVYQFLGCYFHGHTRQPFRDVPTTGKESLAKRYERTMTRIEQITQAGYEVKIMLECEFDREGIVDEKPELLTHPIVQHTGLNTRNALYGGRTEAICLYHKTWEDNETV
jgi:G:T-mismatch repair DNA endonuclease (very short patch repair protein)